MKPLGLNGGVQLGCRMNTDGVPYLASQRFSPPVHLSKPYYDEHTGALLINLSCPTAGLLSGDRMICDIEVSDEASHGRYHARGDSFTLHAFRNC